MKVKVLSRSAASQQTAGSSESRQARNLDPTLHPFERQREYTRALNATKLDRMFAAPFIGQLGFGHVDSVVSMARDPESLDGLASGSADGVVKVWDIGTRSELWQAKAHENLVKGVCWTKDRKLLSCANDKTIKLFDPHNPTPSNAPLATYLGQNAFTSLSHHRTMPSFAVSSRVVSIYDYSRPTNAPLQTLNWPTSVETIAALAWNQVETSILASVAEKSIIHYDLRTSSAIKKITLALQLNSVCWNPMEGFNFAVGSEDHNIYLFDARKMDRALNIYRDHVAAVMDVEFSPTGEELVSASYDRTIRLWDRGTGHSRDIYHTKRMQRVFSATWTSDSKYVLSGSDDGNIRVWRAYASQRNGIKSARQRQQLEYDAALVQRYEHMPEIRRIKRHRHIPKQIKKAGEIKAEELKAIKRRQENVRKHSKKGSMKRKSERDKVVIAAEQ